jgi:hypothetical protein
MTQVLQQAIESLNALPEAQQNQIALRLLEEIRNLKNIATQDDWDMQLEQDVNAGLLDDLIAETLADYTAGRVLKR